MATLYTTLLSANGRKPLAVCRHLGTEVTVETVNVYAGEGRRPGYLAINPFGKVPTLVDGGLVLWESNAIMVYLAEAHGDGALLHQRDPRRRAEVLRWLFWEASAWQPGLTPALAGFVASRVVPSAAPTRDAARVDWGDATLARLTGWLDGHLAGRSYLANDALSLADYAVAAMAMYLRAAPDYPRARWPRFSSWYDRVAAEPAWRATAEGPWAY